MASKLGDAYVDVRADTSQFSRDLNQGVTKSTQGATTEMGRLGTATSKVGTLAKVALAGLAVGAIAKVTDFAQDSIRAYSDLNESINAVNVTFGDNADEVQKLGEAAARNLGLSNSEFNQLSVSVSAFTEKIADNLGQTVPETLDTLTTRIADFASVMNLDVADGFEKFRSGLAGEAEPLRLFGIDVSAATVEQVALAEGLIETGEEMTEAEKVTARYLTIMEQTEKVAGDFANTSEDLANAQRIAAAEMENAKARAGEALVPFAQLTTKLQLLGAETLGVVATGFQVLFGDMTKAQGALQSFEILTGATADTLTAMVTVNQDTGISFEELSEAMNLTAAESVPLTESQKEFLTQLGYTSEEIQALDAILETEHVAALEAEAVALEASALQADGLTTATDGTTGATDELTGATEEAVTALEYYEETVRRQTDPLYDLLAATQDVATAEADVIAAQEEFGEKSPEYEQALIDLSVENMDLVAAQLAVADQSGLTRAEFEKQLSNMANLTPEMVAVILAEFDKINAFHFSDKTISVTYRIGSDPNLRGGARAHGGPVEAGAPYLVGEQGPELMVPAVNGTIIPNNQLGGVNANIVVNLTGGATRSDARLVSDEIMVGLKRLSEARTVA